MRSIKMLIAAFAIMLGISAAFLIYLGALHPIEVKVGAKGPYTMIYKPMVGAYRNVGQAAENMKPLLQAVGIKDPTFVGIYYDDPAKVEKSKLRAEAGFIVPSSITALPESLPEEYRYKIVPRAQYLYAEFPYKGMLSLLMGVLRVYPKLTEALKTRALPQTYGVEIYRPEGSNTLLYMVPLKPTESFHAGPVPHLLKALP